MKHYLAFVMIILLLFLSSGCSPGIESIDDQDIGPAMERDFGILKFQEKAVRAQPGIQTPFVTAEFNKGYKTGYYAAYDIQKGGDLVRAAVQVYDSDKSYAEVKMSMIKWAKPLDEVRNEIIKGAKPQGIELTDDVIMHLPGMVVSREFDYKGSKYICSIKVTEGTRCLWTSNNRLLFVMIETEEKRIKETPNLEDSWKEILSYYLSSFPPTADI